MSRKSPPEFTELFERSPTPKSPPELDQRILDYARRHTPQPERRRQSFFLTVAATLSVACIGLIVVLRSGEVTPPETLARQIPPTMRTASRRNLQADVDNSAERRSRELSTNIARPEAAAETTQSAATALTAPLALAAPQATARDTLEQAPAASDKQSLATIKRVKFKTADAVLFGNDNIQKSLRDIKKLYADGKKREAQQAYRNLRERCKHCKLPVSLLQALEDMELELRR